MNGDLLQELITERTVYFRGGTDFFRCTAVMPMPESEDLDTLVEVTDATDVLIFSNGFHVPVENVQEQLLFVCDGGEYVPLNSVLV